MNSIAQLLTMPTIEEWKKRYDWLLSLKTVVGERISLTKDGKRVRITCTNENGLVGLTSRELVKALKEKNYL